MMETGGILSGMRVVEASAFVAAPLGGMTLAQMGADVIRVDPLGGGLDYRRWPVTDDNTSLFWCGLNKSKRSVTLDLASTEGRELAAALACAPGGDAGMLLTNLPPRGWLDFDKLKLQRPDLIQLLVQGDRHGGSAVDYTVNPRVGLPFITGNPSSKEAVNHVLPAWDLITGQMAAVGLLAAERHRRKTGNGQQVRLALEDVALAVMGHLGFIAEAQLGVVRERQGNYLFGAFGRDFLCADGERIMVVALTLRQWRAMCEAMQLDAAMAALGQRLGLDLREEGHRFRARLDIAEVVAGWVSQHTLHEAARCLDQYGVCWSRYQTVGQLVQTGSAGITDNPLFSSVDQAGVGNIWAPASPLRFDASGILPARPAPQLGADTEEVLASLLGIGQAEFGRLHAKGIVGTA